MQSKWFRLKDKAIYLRKKGNSIRDVELRLGIPRSTLSGWFKDVKLSDIQKKVLQDKWKKALVNARFYAVQWHNAQKTKRLMEAEKSAEETLRKINCNNSEIIELALAMLYWGEGNKKQNTGIGNSDPNLLKFFISAVVKIYKISKSKIQCTLHLRADQDPEKLNKYWSLELGIPLENFHPAAIDKRTVGRTTYSYYKGVCVLDMGKVAIQRKLVYLSRKFSDKIIKMGG